MDKTHNISLGGFSFLIEEKAYQELSSYLHSVKISLGNNPDTEEIIYDIEQRIAELLPPKMAGRQVIIPADVDFLIAKLGRPEQYIDEDFSENQSEKKADFSLKTEKISFRNKKLYRDKERKVLGGVLSGLSHYLGIEVVWLRIILLLSVFAFGSGVVLYIVFWVIIPPAITTAEKLEMKGKSVNINTISSFKDEANAFASKLYRSRKNRLLGGVLGGISDMMAWEVTWVRIVFILLFLGFVPFVTQISGYMTTLYILIWIAVPSEKRNSIFDKNSEDVSSEGNTKVTENQSVTNQKQYATNESKFGIWTIFRAIFKGLGYLVVGFIAFILLIVAISLLLALMGVSLAGLGLGFSGLVMTDFLPYILAGDWQIWVSYIAGTLLLILPFSIITILCLKLFSKNGYQTPRFWVLANVFVFFFGVFGIILVIINTLTHFQTSAWLEEKKTIAPTDTISLSYENISNAFYSNDYIILDNFYFDDKNNLTSNRNLTFQIMKTTENQPFIVIKKQGKGKNAYEARAVAEKIQYPVKIEGNRLVFPQQIFCGKDAKIRDQRINIYLYLPESVCVTSTDNHFSVWDTNNHKRYNLKNGNTVKMTENGLIEQ